MRPHSDVYSAPTAQIQQQMYTNPPYYDTLRNDAAPNISVHNQTQTYQRAANANQVQFLLVGGPQQ